jgi:hypothetical protein
MRLPNDCDGVVMCGASVPSQRGLSDVPGLVAGWILTRGSVPTKGQQMPRCTGRHRSPVHRPQRR